MPDRDAYIRFCEKTPDLPLFMQPWYLDAVCEGGRWDAVLVQKGDRVVAAMPYFLKQKWHWRYVAMPPLARMLGPWVAPEYRKPIKETSILEALIAQLPPDLAAFEQDFNYAATNWLPFYWQGFRQTTRYSYVLSVKNLDTVWKNFAADYRNQKIPKAQGTVEVNVRDSLADFLDVHDLTYDRQGRDSPISIELLRPLDTALAARGQRAIFFATDRASGAVHSVAYLTWDAQSAYYLLAGDNPDLRQSGASILLVWEAIRYTHEVLKLPTFDFAGSMLRSIERVRRQFGAVQKPYFRVQKEWSPIWKIGKMLLR